MQSASRYPLIASLLLLFGAACATSGPISPLGPMEKVRRETILGIELAHHFDVHFKIRLDPEVRVYLRELAHELAESNAELKVSGLGVITIQDRDEKWHNYALPGGRIYISVGLLRGVEYENELAAAIAFELGHVSRRHALSRLRENRESAKAVNPVIEGLVLPQPGELLENIDFFSPSGMFAFTETQYMTSVDTAVELLYRAGFDPRGLIGLWARLQTNLGRSPYDDATLAKLMEHTRRVIAFYAPLRNPIVRSQAFLAIQKRIRRL